MVAAQSTPGPRPVELVAMVNADSFSRIDKVFIDTQHLPPERASERRAACHVDLVCGPEVAHSRTLQAALATAMHTAARCYPDAVGLIASPEVRETLQKTHTVDLPTASTTDCPVPRYTIAFGSTSVDTHAMQVSFNGWTAQVAPVVDGRLEEHEANPLAGVLAGSLAVSETFLNFADVAPDATHRTVVLSLWQPHASAPDAGPQIEYLPTRAWLAGLGHLGQAYAWAYAWLPWDLCHERPELWLVDDDTLVDANLETGVLSERNRLGDYKTRVVSAWLEARAIRTRIIERRFSSGVQLQVNEPPLLLGGVDHNRARHMLALADGRLVDAGLGAIASNFHSITLRDWPNPRSPDELWPIDIETASATERLVDNNPVYETLSSDHCGRVRLAERSVGVPFVGTAAAAFAWAQPLRDLHGGKHVSDLKLKLASPRDIEAYGQTCQAEDLTSIAFLYASRDH